MNEAIEDPLTAFNRLMAARDREKGISRHHYGPRAISPSSYPRPYRQDFSQPPPGYPSQSSRQPRYPPSRYLSALRAQHLGLLEKMGVLTIFLCLDMDREETTEIGGIVVARRLEAPDTVGNALLQLSGQEGTRCTTKMPHGSKMTRNITDGGRKKTGRESPLPALPPRQPRSALCLPAG